MKDIIIKKMQNQIEIKKEVIKMKQVFVSYHYTSKDGKYNLLSNDLFFSFLLGCLSLI